jgi:2-polyprenyl-3-methyl-5-hydroxy-6-metoxy-1,4-benzoquinol methylase
MELDSQKTQTYFHQHARQFDSLYDEKRDLAHYFNRFFRYWLYRRVELTVQEFDGLTDFSVLDVGCGSGRNSVIFAKAGAKRVLGIDFADNMIDLARQYSSEQDVANCCEFLKQDALTFHTSEKFDVVAALGVFDYTADPRPLLAGMKTLSKGKVVGSFPGISLFRTPQRKIRYILKNCPVYFYNRKRLENACRDVGFEDFSVQAENGGLFLVARTRP